MTCTVDKCDNLAKSKSYCGMHYARLKRNNSFEPIRTYEKHGYRKTPEYNSWWGMRDRCYNVNRKSYKDYGGRGITICDRWLHSFTNFLQDMGRKPSPLHSIDRIDNDGNYEPGNCKWSTRSEQQYNRRPRVRQGV